MIKAVFFDFDGTLVSTDQVIFKGYKYLFDTYKPDYTPSLEEYKSFLGPALRDVFPKYFKEDVEFLIKEYREHSYPFLTKENIQLHKGVIEALEWLKKHNIKAVIITSRENRSTINVLKIHEMEEYIDYIIGYDDVIKTKPDPEAFFKGLNILNLNNNEVFMVGDHIADIMGARNANIKAYGVEWSNMGANRLLEVGATGIIKDMLDIIDIIKEINHHEL